MLKVILKKRSSLQLEKERKLNQEVEKKEREFQSKRRSSLQFNSLSKSKSKSKHLSSSIGNKMIEFNNLDLDSSSSSSNIVGPHSNEQINLDEMDTDEQRDLLLGGDEDETDTDEGSLFNDEERDSIE